MNIFFKFIFHFLLLFLIVLSLFPGSLIGLLFYGDLGLQPTLISNPFGTTLNHFIVYFFLSLLGFFTYLKDVSFKKVLYAMIFFAVVLEVLHLIVPKRSFQVGDLVGNILGVLLAYFLVKIYLSFKNHE